MGKNDLYLKYSSRGRRRGGGKKRILAAVCVIILALAIGVGVYFFAQDIFTKAKDGSGESVPEITTSADQTVSVVSDAGFKIGSLGSDNLEDAKVVAGPYGIWTTKKEDPAASAIKSSDVWMGDFVDQRTRVVAKGIYVSAAYASTKLEEVLDLLDRTELNAVVIDIKDDYGKITYQMNNNLVKEINAATTYFRDMEQLVKTFKEHGVYLIARVVALKDPVLADARTDLALRNRDGTIFRDRAGDPWVNPYKQEVWDYLAAVAAECAEIGFDEVNFDYIRFSTDSGMSDVDFGEEAKEFTRIEAISKGIKELCEKLKPMGVFVSCDVYGAIISSSVDAKIVGQAYREMGRYLDYICPMVYPSHYGDGYYGLDYPDLHPYELVNLAMIDSIKILSTLPEDENKAIVRPWLQDFTASWLKHHKKYTGKEVREQINAVYDAGYGEWLLWNAAINYSQEALEKQ